MELSMKLLLLSRYSRLGASSRLRSYQYLPYLQSQGVEVTVSPFFDDAYLMGLYAGQKIRWLNIVKGYLRRVAELLRSRQYDLIWLEKELFPWLPAIVEICVRRSGIPYVVDYDDAIFHRYDTHPNPLVRTFLAHKIDAVMRRAAMVVTGNDYLADRARSAGAKRIEYLPTVIDLNRYEIRREHEGNPFTVGWVGTQVTVNYLNKAASALADVAAKRWVKIVAVGPQRMILDNLPIEVLPWSEETEVERICDFDVGIMPLHDDLWERGKCGYKLIQYMACGIPVIASPVGVNRKIVEHGCNGFLASTHSEWVNYLLILADDRRLARQMGEAGRGKVEREYCLQVTAPKLIKLMRQIVR